MNPNLEMLKLLDHFFQALDGFIDVRAIGAQRPTRCRRTTGETNRKITCVTPMSDARRPCRKLARQPAICSRNGGASQITTNCIQKRQTVSAHPSSIRSYRVKMFCWGRWSSIVIALTFLGMKTKNTGPIFWRCSQSALRWKKRSWTFWSRFQKQIRSLLNFP